MSDKFRGWQTLPLRLSKLIGPGCVGVWPLLSKENSVVAPVTGPFQRDETVLGLANSSGFRPVDIQLSRRWYRQRKPHNLPLSFTFQRAQVVRRWELFASSTPWGATEDKRSYPAAEPTTLFPDVYNKAYEKFKNKLAPATAGMAVNLAQRKQAIDMIAARSLQIGRFASSLLRRDFGSAAKALGLTDRQLENVGRKRGKPLADAFLEAHFGWQPLVGDIGSAVEILQSGVPPTRVTAQHKRRRAGSTRQQVSADWYNQLDQSDTGVWKIGADVVVTNPNLWLANQLGFVNPALVAWDVVPFSFVLNWFVTVEEFLSGFTDLWGLALANAYITSLWSSDDRIVEMQKNWGSPPKVDYTPIRDYNFKRVQEVRLPGSIPGPSLLIRQPWRLSPTRGLTAVSLLIQQLARLR